MRNVLHEIIEETKLYRSTGYHCLEEAFNRAWEKINPTKKDIHVHCILDLVENGKFMVKYTNLLVADPKNYFFVRVEKELE